MKRAFAVALLLSALSAPWVAAQVPAGPEFQVNTFTLFNQWYSNLGFDGAGNFVVVWTSDTQDGSLSGVFGQRYDASGTRLGPEFQANTTTATAQYGPDVAADAAGNFVVVWTSYQQDGHEGGVIGRRYDSSGVPRGPEFQVNTYTPFFQGNPSVASDAAGNFVVAWDDAYQDGDAGIYAQRFDASGARRGSEFRVNTHTLGDQRRPAVASGAAGDFVVVWHGYAVGYGGGVFARAYDASGAPLGAEFRVSPCGTCGQGYPSVASDAAANFVVAWESSGRDGSSLGVIARRFDASGAARGDEFQVNTYTTDFQNRPSVASDATGNFVVTWQSWAQDGSAQGIYARRFDASGAPRGGEVQVNTWTTLYQRTPAVAADAAGNWVVAWNSWQQDGSQYGIFAQRFGGLVPAALDVDPAATSGSDGNGVLEAGETVEVLPAWANLTGKPQTFDGSATRFTGPPASGVSYSLVDGTGAYGTVADAAVARCSDCYELAVGFGGSRPSLHWDAVLTEAIAPDALGETVPWRLHVGESFTDVPRTDSYYRFVETMLHRGVTTGCSPSTYCPSQTTTREQMSVFALVAKEGAGYLPVACTTPVFADVPASSPYCRWIEELARRGVVTGCGGGKFCPTAQVSREQMPVFMLRTLDPALTPPGCTTPVFADVPASSPYCRWVKELAERGVVTGCGDGKYCPADAVTREQMAVFVSGTFGLTLYGP